MSQAIKISDLPNLGPKSQQMLALAGISTPEQLREIGSISAYCRVKQTHPNASLNLLWALEGAILETPWQKIAREHRLRLLLALEDYQRGF